jgi:RNA-binding protein
MLLSLHQKRYLRGLAHALDPVILVGQKGVTPSLVKELDGALAHHELVKVKLADADRDDRADSIELLREGTKAELVQTIGRIACFYRLNPEQTKIELPRK